VPEIRSNQVALSLSSFVSASEHSRRYRAGLAFGRLQPLVGLPPFDLIYLPKSTPTGLRPSCPVRHRPVSQCLRAYRPHSTRPGPAKTLCNFVLTHVGYPHDLIGRSKRRELPVSVNIKSLTFINILLLLLVMLRIIHSFLIAFTLLIPLVRSSNMFYLIAVNPNSPANLLVRASTAALSWC
jgi:hypothetical protein